MDLDDPKIQAAREAVYKDTLPDPEFRAAMRWSRRTLARHIRSGLPHLKVGRARMFHLPTVREYVLAKERIVQPRSPGRPHK